MSTAQVVQHCLGGGFEPWWLVTREKRPVTPRWGTRPATADRIANLREGEEAGLVPGSIQHRVVDVDGKDGKKQHLAWADLQPLLEVLGSPSWSMRSMSGKGWHLWYRTSRRVGNASWELGGLSGEIRDTRGYVVMMDPTPVWEKDLAALPVVDDWSALVQKPATQSCGVTQKSSAVAVFRRAASSSARSAARIEQAIAAIRAAPVGARNITVNRESYIAGLCGGNEADLEELEAVSFLTFRTVEGGKVARRAFAAGRAARTTG